MLVRLNLVKRLTERLEQLKTKVKEATGQSTSVNKLTKEFEKQDGYVSRLLKRMAVYASWSAFTNLLRSVREVTAEFELQRVSLGAIIQDQQRANQLFAEIKSFALTSPLKILDFTKYTKQVAVYGFETERIFDVTKMPTDVSVGLGTNKSPSKVRKNQSAMNTTTHIIQQKVIINRYI